MGQHEPASIDSQRGHPGNVRPPGSPRSRAMLAWFGVDTDLLSPPSSVGVAEPIRQPGLARSLMGAAILALLGGAIGIASGDTHFGWVGGLAAGAQVTAWTARSLRLGRVATGLGMVAFFATMVLFLSALLVGMIAALPVALEKLLG